MRCFLGLPLTYGDEMVGLLGLANREQGYDEKLVTLLAPLGSSCASLIQALRLEADRAAASATLAEHENRLRVILETAADCFIEVGPNGCITEWNRLAETSLKVARDAAVGRPVDDVVKLRTVDGEPASLLTFRPADDGSLGRPREVMALLPDGGSFPAELVMWPVPATAGVGHCAFLRNIEERKQLEEQQRLRFQSETLLKEVHHRIKNNMQVISSLLSIQSSKLANERQRGVFLECRERIRAMSLIHDRLYSTGNYEQIDFGDYLREMLTLIVSSNRTDGTDVDVDLQAMPLWVPVERAVPLSLIASELVLNALKHGCQGRPRGKITVRLTKRGDNCELFVGDDGPGMDAAAEDRPGVGMQLIDSLTRQIRGSYEVEGSPPGWGVSVRWREA
jgi:PAS domain S-box-containing protein